MPPASPSSSGTLVESGTVHHHVLATAELDRTEDYLARGREFLNASAAELQESFVTAYRMWSEDVADRAVRRAAEDLTAEYRLRQLEPPYDLVRDCVDRIAHAAATDLVSLSDAVAAETPASPAAEPPPAGET